MLDFEASHSSRSSGEIALNVVVESETRIIEDTDDIYFDYRVVIFTKETSFMGPGLCYGAGLC